MSDLQSSPESNIPPQKPSVEVLESQDGGVRRIIFNESIYDEKGFLITDKAQELLEQVIGKKLNGFGGGNTKEVFFEEDGEEIFILNIKDDDPLLKQQVRFYWMYRNNESFRNIVVPMTRIIEDSTQSKIIAGKKVNATIGMVQERYGKSLFDYLSGGGKLTSEQINELIEGYRDLIRVAGYAHPDLLFDDNVINFQNIRVGPDGKLKFIDYHGTDGVFRLDGIVYHRSQNPQGYRRVIESHPDRLARVLSSPDLPKLLRIFK